VYNYLVSVVFLFGAGASYGSVDCTPYPPPLGKNLFPDLLISGGFATTIEGELRRRFEEDFEMGMEMFRETRNVEIPTLLREMSRYFIQFTPGPNNLYRRLATMLSQRQKNLGEQVGERIVLATLNYDLLLEQAILDVGSAVRYPAYPTGHHAYFPSTHRPRQDIVNSYWEKYNAIYPVGTSGFEMLKVHGSCNFLLDIPPENFRRVTYQNVGVAVEGPAKPVLPADRVLDWLMRSDSSLAPAISMYAEGKDVFFSRNYVLEHQSRFQAAVKEAEKIFLVGVAIQRTDTHDTHIWDHIADSNAWLGYVGGEPDNFCAWCRKTEHSDYKVLGTYFEDALPLIGRALDDVALAD
jgi:hypothetical protein